MSIRSMRRVLAGVDFSACSRRALAQADRLAAAAGAELHVLHVVEDQVLQELAEALQSDVEPLRRDVLDDAGRHLADFCGEDARIRRHLVAGELLPTVLQVVASTEADLLVLGIRGEAEGDGAGSLAVGCCRRSPVPVLLVREEHQGAYRTIVVGTDFSDNAGRAVGVALELARLEGARLAVVHAFRPP
ncbi:MAG TPA: universal stress protein, partial [Planctomycetota bacterium]|nr:universal stress protein [Planctomycetota bacterium]